jgi:hypothetical protein
MISTFSDVCRSQRHSHTDRPFLRRRLELERPRDSLRRYRVLSSARKLTAALQQNVRDIFAASVKEALATPVCWSSFYGLSFAARGCGATRGSSGTVQIEALCYESTTMSENAQLSLQLSIVCLLVFLNCATAVIQHPGWFQ